MRTQIFGPSATKPTKNDARASAPLVRTGWFKAVDIKSEESLRLRLLLTHRRTLKRKMLDNENEVRQSVKVFGIRLGSGFGHVAFAKRVRAALTGDAFLLWPDGMHAARLGGAVGRV